MTSWKPWLGLTLLVVAGSCTRSSSEAPASEQPRASTRPLAAGPAFLVKNITTNPESSPNWYSSPTELVTMGGVAYFAAQDSFGGRELWKSDGTEAGTVRVRDIAPGAASSSPESLFVWNNTLFFRADDGATGKELWKSDGTVAGTMRVKDTCQGVSDSSLTVFNGALYFAARDCSSDPRLWKTDGTEAGTVMVGDSATLPIVFVENLTAAGSSLFFTGSGPNGRALFKTDGTTAGTVELARLDTIAYPMALGGVLYFVGTGSSLWRSDGTPSGTHAIQANCPSCTAFQVGSTLTPVGNVFYFSASDGVTGAELWKSDGTDAGTVLVKDLNPGSDSSYPSGFVPLGDRIYFFAESSGYSLWSTDGTAAGTTLIARVDSEPSQLTAVGNQLLFEVGGELWKSDGTTDGTMLVKDIYVGANDSNPHAFVALGSTVLFAATDGPHERELWKTDGTEAGTVLVKDIQPAIPGAPTGIMADVNGTLFFSADDGPDGIELWRTDGTQAGTMLVKDISPGSASSRLSFLVNVNGTLFLNANDELWKSDGTPGGTVRVKDPTIGAKNPVWLTPLGNLVIFTATDPDASTELWRSDGTEAGTYRVADIVPGLNSSNPSSLIAFGGKVYFIADAPSENLRKQLWMTDGTGAGTQFLKDISAQTPVVFNGVLYWAGGDGTSGYELWKSDGTPAGTQLVKDIFPGEVGSDPSELTPSGSALFFTAYTPETHRRELWKTDGTSAGTQRVGTSSPNPTLAPHDLAPVRGNIAYRGFQPGSGFELWASGGVAPLKDFVPGPIGGLIGERLLPIEDESALIFSAAADTTGAELWLSDGTTAGTRQLQDILPGPDSSNPTGFTRSGDLVYFNAMDRTDGHQLWALRIADLGDLRPPTLVCPTKTVVEATSPEGATVSFTASASDNKTQSPSIIYGQAPGSTFPVGRTTVMVSSVDEASNTATCTFDVVVQDTTPPTLECPANIQAVASSAAGAPVSFTLPSSTDVVSSPVAVTANPASGSFFPVGSQFVVVTARDTAGNSRECQFSVSVSQASGTDGGTEPGSDGGTQGGPDGGTSPGDEKPPASEGCGCTSSSGASLLAVLAGLVLLGQRRRRFSP